LLDSLLEDKPEKGFMVSNLQVQPTEVTEQVRTIDEHSKPLHDSTSQRGKRRAWRLTTLTWAQEPRQQGHTSRFTVRAFGAKR
jgi:hypothetical protein